MKTKPERDEACETLSIYDGSLKLHSEGANRHESVGRTFEARI